MPAPIRHSLLALALAGGPLHPASPAAKVTAAEARAAFLEAYKVFMHPRCLNCHPSGDRPLQGEDSHIHTQNVVRGPSGEGVYALKCANCHQEANVPGPGRPPGNPSWRLPPPEMPLVFQGRSPAALARQLKDPDQNGGLSLAQLLHHVAEDPLVKAGWNPGEGRPRPPISQKAFAQLMKRWVEGGTPVPE